MPASRRFTWKRACRSPVTVPATAPPANAAAVATRGGTSATRSTAAIAAPTVIEPSAVMSGKSKMRKLMNTPIASSERISPIVSAPSSSVMRGSRADYLCDRSEPAGAAREFALAATDGGSVVVQQVEHAQQLVGFEAARDGLAQLEAPPTE